MKSQKIKVTTVPLRTDGPTRLHKSDLFRWVIWQFPRPKGDGLCGAVHPPLANHTWYPALILTKQEHIIVHGHAGQDFASPEDAARWLELALSGLDPLTP